MRDLNHPRFWQTQLYRSRRAERLGHALYALLTGALVLALVAGFSALRR
jgi:hypothetical protein